MAAIYKVLSAILSYPGGELQSAAPDLIAVVNAERALPAPSREGLVALIEAIASGDLLDVQSDYVDLFDRTRALSLHMFEHVHGESRDRGQAMVSLRDRYRKAGVDIAANELPDYIPLFLEFVSLLSPAEASTTLSEPVHILQSLRDRLNKRGSPYAAVFDALIALSHAKPASSQAGITDPIALDDPNDLAALDRAWEETEVRFGPGDASDGCPKASNILASMTAPRDEKEAIARLVP